eukprot:6977480-Karenia_brevis.AAC.1
MPPGTSRRPKPPNARPSLHSPNSTTPAVRLAKALWPTRCRSTPRRCQNSVATSPSGESVVDATALFKHLMT